jgi:mono/diheme cytochrome c family protein
MVVRHAWFTAAFVTLMVALAYGDDRAPQRDETWIAPASVAAKINPLASRTDTISGGNKLYQQRCATCHGEDGRGSPKAPDLTEAAVQAQSDGALFWKISSGNTRHGMPSFSFLPELQRWQLVQTVRSKP